MTSVEARVLFRRVCCQVCTEYSGSLENKKKYIQVYIATITAWKVAQTDLKGKKYGFGVPYSHWLATSLNSSLRELVLTTTL